MAAEHTPRHVTGQLPLVLHVVVSRDGEVVSADALQPGVYTLGSADDCDVVLSDTAVAAQHAVLFVEKGRAMLQDCGAAKGLTVNGVAVTSCEVSRKDSIRCGPFSVKAYLAQAKPKKRVEELAKTTAGRRTPAPIPAPSPTQLVGIRTEIEGPELSAELSLSPFKPSARPPASPRPQVSHLEPTKLRLPVAASLATEALTSPTTPGRKLTSHKQGAVRVGGPAREQAHAAESRELLLTLELYWGLVRQQVRSFSPKDRAVHVTAEDSAQFPLWGFSLPKGGFPLSRIVRTGYRLRIPSRATIELKRDDGFYPCKPSDVRTDSAGRFIDLQGGQAIRLTEGKMALVASVNPAPLRPLSRPLAAVPKLLVGLFLCFATLLGALIAMAPGHDELADRPPQGPPQVAVRLIMPQEPPPPPPPEEPKEEEPPLEELKEEEVVKKEEEPPPEVKPKKEKRPRKKAAKAFVQKTADKVVEEDPGPPPAQTKALKAIEKLAAAGPAMGDMLAAVDKLGNGPGSKKVKSSSFRLSGLIGNAPVANAGIGTFGLGGRGGGGRGTLGAEILRGKGGGGIGAFGAGGFGRSGRVGGTVSRAVARNVAVQGTIDREAVLRVVNGHLQEVRACYERALLKEPGLAGKVALEWTINTSGLVVTARTKNSSLRNGGVEGCILSALKTWRFPPAKGGIVVISYPFIFNSVGY